MNPFRELIPISAGRDSLSPLKSLHSPTHVSQRIASVLCSPSVTVRLVPYKAQEHTQLPSPVGWSLETSPAFPELPVNKLNSFELLHHSSDSSP